jgi:mono/diheme cytochrome c family protein
MAEFMVHMRGALIALLSCLALAAVVARGPILVAQKAATKIDAPELYKTNCLACHGPDGNSPLEPLSFVDTAWKHGSRLQDIVKVVTDGVEMTPMLPFKEKLTKEEILAIAKLVRSFDKSLASTKAPAKKKPEKKDG